MIERFESFFVVIRFGLASGFRLHKAQGTRQIYYSKIDSIHFRIKHGILSTEAWALNFIIWLVDIFVTSNEIYWWYIVILTVHRIINVDCTKWIAFSIVRSENQLLCSMLHVGCMKCGQLYTVPAHAIYKFI